MAYKFVVLLSVLAAANAGFIAEHGAIVAAPTITSGHQNILRTPGNLGQVSTYSKTIDTPFSSVSKSDVRVSNPGLAVHAAYAAPAPVAYAHAPAPVAYAHAPAPVAYAHAPAPVTYAHAPAPVAYTHAHAAPVSFAAPVAPVATVAKIAAPVAYTAPIAKIATPVAYAAPIAKIAAPVAYAAPAYPTHHHYESPIAKVAAAPALLGVAYSAAPAVSHMSYSNNLGLTYAW